MADTDVDRLRTAVAAHLPKDWRTSDPAGYPRQIELALIAAVFRGADEPDVAFQVTSRFMQARPGKRLDDLADLGRMTTEAIAGAVGEPFASATVVGASRLRVDLAGDLAASLAAVDVHSAEHFRAAALDRPVDLERTCTEVKHSGPATFLQLATLLRADTRPGSGVAEWVREHVGEPGMSRADVHRVLQEAARKSGSEPFVLHYAIARHVAGDAGPDAATAPARTQRPAAKKKPAAKKAGGANQAPAKKASAKKKPAGS